MSKGVWKPEEQYILRVKDPELAKKIRSVLREEGETSSKLELIFQDSDVNGKLRFEGKQYQLTVLNLPCVTECYKTYDDINLVKVSDVGQVLVVGEIQETEATTGFATDGVAPPMRNARQRIFRKAISVGTDVVHQVEGQILDILAGGAPPNYKFIDHEEIWQVDPVTGRGAWVPLKK